jgi:hypothetical protein
MNKDHASEIIALANLYLIATGKPQYKLVLDTLEAVGIQGDALNEDSVKVMFNRAKPRIGSYLFTHWPNLRNSSDGK